MDLRSRILESAKDLFFKNGFFKVNTRTIATEAGTSESGVFRTFNSKYDILMAVYDESWGKANQYIEDKTLPRAEDPRDQLVNVVQALWKFYDHDRLSATFMIMNTGNTDTLLIETKENAIITTENIKYVNRICSLCSEVVAKKLCSDKMTDRALSEGILGISEGVLLGWYLHDKTDKVKNAYPDKVTIDEATEVLNTLLYTKT